MSTVLLDQIEEIANEYESDDQIEEKVLEDLFYAIKLEMYQRSTATDFKSYDAGDFGDDDF